MRNTKQKTAIRKCLSCGGHLSAEEIYLQIRDEIKIDMSTIYRNLNALVEQCEVEKILNPEGVAVYHITDKHHGHLICKTCNGIFEIPCSVCEGIHTISKEMNFKDTDHVINIYGYCSKCKGEK